MATKLVLLQDAATGTGNGTSSATSAGLNVYAFQTIGTFTATVKIEGSFDGGTTWVQIGSDITTATITHLVDKPVPLLRARVSAYTSGTLTVYGLI